MPPEFLQPLHQKGNKRPGSQRKSNGIWNKIPHDICSWHSSSTWPRYKLSSFSLILVAYSITPKINEIEEGDFESGLKVELIGAPGAPFTRVLLSISQTGMGGQRVT